MAGRPKLLTRPPRTEQLLHRQRLIDAAGPAPVVAIVGPPGSGCTSAAAQIAQSAGSRVAWCRLAHGYNSAADVLDMIAETVGVETTPARRVVDLADQLLDLFDVGALTVVIDDYHLAVDGDLDRVIAECAALMPEGSRVIVAGSTRPAGLIGLVGPGDIRVVDAVDLAFDDDEARTLFGHHGAGLDDAVRWNRVLAGWAQGIVAGAHAPKGDPAQHVGALLAQLVELGAPAISVLDTVASVPYVTPQLLVDLGIEIDGVGLSDIVRRTPLLTDHDGFVRIADAAAGAHRTAMAPGRVNEIKAAAGMLLALDDPTSAIDLLIEAGQPDSAADVLADHLSEIGVERALNWLYRLPAELRRRFPPVLAAGKATVEVDAARAAAEVRVEVATTERSRREALYALGSIEAHRGELAAAAGAFEAALRSARGDADGSERISQELAITRWLLGDLIGARSALADAARSPSMSWLSAQLDAVDGVIPVAQSSVADETYAAAVAALAALVQGDGVEAGVHSARSYRLAVEAGGEPLVAASAARAWALLVDEAYEEALVVAEELERRLGPHHQLARVHGAIVRERCSRVSGDAGRHERDQRRLRDLRTRGYATIERLASRLLDGDSSGRAAVGLEVCVMGDQVVVCDRRTIRRAEWKSKKALEVLAVLASFGTAGGRREQIIEAVWPDRESDKGRTLLRTALSDIRRVLEPDRPPGEGSRYLTAHDDIIRLDGILDLDRLDDLIATDPTTAFVRLNGGLAPTVVGTEWAEQWRPRIERLTVLAASNVPENAERLQRIEALEALVTAEPWLRAHYDRLAELHRVGGDDAAAADVERRWFADE